MVDLTCSFEGCEKDSKIGTEVAQYCGEHAYIITKTDEE